MENFFSQTWQVQLALASGFAAYLVAFMGIRHHHQAIEVTFWSILFSLVTTATLAFVPDWDNFYAGVAAFAATVVAAVLWRKWFSDFLFNLLRMGDVSWSNDDPSALFTVSNSTKFRITQVAVELEDGTWLRCDDADKFKDTPFGPLTVGPNGDIALYLTHEEPVGQPAKELKSVRHDGYGDRITYVPADKIRQITFRHLPKS
jgi:hypothetical protein